MDQKQLAKLPIEEQEKLKKFAEINKDGKLTLPSKNVYEFTKLNHKLRRRVFARYQAVEEKGLMFFDSEEFDVVSGIIDDCVLFDGMQLSKLPNHWDKNIGEMITFYTYAMGAITSPFFAGGM